MEADGLKMPHFALIASWKPTGREAHLGVAMLVGENDDCMAATAHDIVNAGLHGRTAVSPRLMLLAACQAARSTSSVTNRVEPSQNAAVTPPTCLLRDTNVYVASTGLTFVQGSPIAGRSAHVETSFAFEFGVSFVKT